MLRKMLRQVDPLSPIKFILCLEHLAIILRQNSQCCGLKIGAELVKVFADNTEIYLKHSATQFKFEFRILEAIGSKSVCKVNLSKSWAFCLGASKKKYCKTKL